MHLMRAARGPSRGSAKVVLIAVTLPGEGKSTTAFLAAVSSTRSGKNGGVD
jgi:Mrp family chromosome partitioning ATPase